MAVMTLDVDGTSHSLDVEPLMFVIGFAGRLNDFRGLCDSGCAAV